MMNISKIWVIATFSMLGLITLGSCSDSDDETVTEETTQTETTGDTTETEETDETASEEEDFSDWTDATHSKSVDPNFDIVFNDASVMRLDIKIDSDTWTEMQSNLASVLASATGTSGAAGGPPPGGGPGGGQGGGQATSEDGYVQNTSFDNPDWFSCSVFYNDIEWYHVGVRFKGNSSLQRAYEQGDKKLSFKFDFDEFEDDYPDLKNQRFYGFKQLNLNNNFMDESFMREKVTADMFRQFGVAAPHTRFCAVYVDHGDGVEFYGVYTMVEEVDDTVLEEQFSDEDGNLYKPDGDAASFGAGTYDEDEFVKKSNEDEADFTDVAALYEVINDTEGRTSDPETWRADVEAVLNVPIFLKWLAANVVMQNWDTYGKMTHNYFLYNDPENGLLTWIPWDNNEALQDKNSPLSLSLSEVTDMWPLIYCLLTQDTYRSQYEANVEAFATECYTSSQLHDVYDTYKALLQDYASQEGNSNFSSAVSQLKQHVTTRSSAALSAF